MKTIVKRLVLDVTYDVSACGEVGRQLASEMLDGLVKHAAGEGLLSGSSDLEVHSWSASVLDVEDGVLARPPAF